MYVDASGALLAHNLTIRNNTALETGEAPAGGGLYNLGNVTLFGGLVHDNHAPNAPGANIFNGANFNYVLPTPLGFYLDGVFTCGLARCPKSPGSSTLVPCAQQSCDSDLLDKRPVARLQQGPIEDPLPTACPPGFHAASADRDDQTTALCSGACPEGFTCPDTSTTKPVPAPPGFYAPKGSTASIPCGGQSFYCPGASGAPQQVDAGYETFTDTTLPDAHALDVDDPSTRTSQRNCSLAWCSGGQAFNCTAGSFANLSLPVALRTNERAACISCQPNSTTAADGGTGPSDCICIVGFYADLRHAVRRCASCPDGFDCSGGPGFSTTTLLVQPGYWRPSASATTAERCPIDGTCAGGATALNFSLADARSCLEGFKGPFCTDCVDSSRYVSTSSTGSACVPCGRALVFFGALIVACAAGLLAVVSGFVLHARCRRLPVQPPLLEPLQADVALPVADEASVGPQQLPSAAGAVPPLANVAMLDRLGGAWRQLKADIRTGTSHLYAAVVHLFNSPLLVRLRAASEATSLPKKIKICLGISLVIAQIPSAYQMRYPPAYHSAVSTLFAPLRGQLLGWIPGLHLSCLGVTHLVHELALYTLLPAAIVALAFGISWLRRRSLLPALPFVLYFTYFIFPSISSKGFQALAQCKCFEHIDGSRQCLLPSDWHVECPIDGGLRVVALLAVLLYGLGVPLLYATLLYRCRHAILTRKPTPLSDALVFLHGAFQPSALWWPPVEALRALILTGFLALVQPGSITQLLCGLVVSFAFAVLQIYFAPYSDASNNLLAMAAGCGLVLHFVTSVGVQVDAMEGDVVDDNLLLLGLLAAAFGVFVITAISFLSAQSFRVKASEIRELLVGYDGGGAPGASPVFGRRDGQMTITWKDIMQALNAPLLSKEEVESLQVALVEAAQNGAPTTSRHTTDAADLVLGEAGAAARGVAAVVGVPCLELYARMSHGVAAIERECEEHGTDEAKQWLNHVLHEESGAHSGERLAHFVNHPNSRAAGLEEAHVVALRWFTSPPASELLNAPLRNRGQTEPHPFAATIGFLHDGIKRLRAVEDADEAPPLRLWCGLRNVRAPDELRNGCTGLAPLSTTPDVSKAAAFSAGREAFIFLLTAKSFMQHGADLSYLSCLPHEREVSYPPCTYLKPTGRTQRLELPGELRCVVVEVTPHMGS